MEVFLTCCWCLCSMHVYIYIQSGKPHCHIQYPAFTKKAQHHIPSLQVHYKTHHTSTYSSSARFLSLPLSLPFASSLSQPYWIINSFNPSCQSHHAYCNSAPTLPQFFTWNQIDLFLFVSYIKTSSFVKCSFAGGFQHCSGGHVVSRLSSTHM